MTSSTCFLTAPKLSGRPGELQIQRVASPRFEPRAMIRKMLTDGRSSRNKRRRILCEGRESMRRSSAHRPEWLSQRATACKAPRHRWHLRQPWHCEICNLQNLKGPGGVRIPPSPPSFQPVNTASFDQPAILLATITLQRSRAWRCALGDSLIVRERTHLERVDCGTRSASTG